MARTDPEIPYMLFTNGKFDHFVGNKLALPVLKKVAYLMSVRTFARVSIYGACFACAVFSLAEMVISGDWTYLIGLAAAGIWFFFYRARLHEFERYSDDLLNDTVLNLNLVRVIEYIAFARVFCPAFGGLIMVLNLVTGNYSGVLITLLLYSVLILGYYAATCVMPRRKIKSLAKAKAWWQRATAPSPVLHPAKVGV